MKKKLLNKLLKNWKVLGNLLLRSSLFFIISCSLNFKKNTISNEDLKKSLEKLCLNSSGKGRIRFEQENFLFRYDSEVQKKDKNWIIAVNLPGMGHEEMMLGYASALDDSVRVKGSFYSRFYSSIKKSENKKLLRTLLKSWGQFLIWHQKMISGKHEYECAQLKNESRGYCQISKEVKVYYSLGHINRFSFKLNDDKEFTILAKSPQKKFYPSFSLNLKNWGHIGPESSIFELSFFISSCAN